MTRWRPPPHIRVKAIGLHWRDGCLLAADVPDDSGHVKGVRPLGGTVDFGEPLRDAVIREFAEELGIPVTVPGPPRFLENIYIHEGHPGHEVVAVFDVTFPEEAFAGQTRLRFLEDDGTPCHAAWHDPDALDGPGQLPLFPVGLKALLRRTDPCRPPNEVQ